MNDLGLAPTLGEAFWKLVAARAGLPIDRFRATMVALLASRLAEGSALPRAFVLPGPTRRSRCSARFRVVPHDPSVRELALRDLGDLAPPTLRLGDDVLVDVEIVHDVANALLGLVLDLDRKLESYANSVEWQPPRASLSTELAHLGAAVLPAGLELGVVELLQLKTVVDSATQPLSVDTLRLGGIGPAHDAAELTASVAREVFDPDAEVGDVVALRDSVRTDALIDQLLTWLLQRQPPSEHVRGGAALTRTLGLRCGAPLSMPDFVSAKPIALYAPLDDAERLRLDDALEADGLDLATARLGFDPDRGLFRLASIHPSLEAILRRLGLVANHLVRVEGTVPVEWAALDLPNEVDPVMATLPGAMFRTRGPFTFFESADTPGALVASVEPSGLALSGEVFADLWQEWCAAFARDASHWPLRHG